MIAGVGDAAVICDPGDWPPALMMLLQPWLCVTTDGDEQAVGLCLRLLRLRRCVMVKIAFMINERMSTRELEITALQNEDVGAFELHCGAACWRP